MQAHLLLRNTRQNVYDHLMTERYLLDVVLEIVELLARVETILRRAGKTQTIITVEDLVIDTRSRSVTRGGREIQLTMKEYELLLLFVRNRNIALFRETLYERVWENDYMGDSRTVDLHVQRLRKKLHWEDKIKAIYKVGYRLEV